MNYYLLKSVKINQIESLIWQFIEINYVLIKKLNVFLEDHNKNFIS